MTYATSSAVEMHKTGFKTNAEIRSVKSKNSTMKGTYPRRHHVILLRLEERLMASKL
jgi:hypothetical protein